MWSIRIAINLKIICHLQIKKYYFWPRPLCSYIMVSPGVSSSLEILLAAGALLQPPTLGVKVEVVTIHHEKTSAKK